MLKFFAKIRDYMKHNAAQADAIKAVNEETRHRQQTENGDSWMHDRKEWERIMVQPYDPAAWKERQRLKRERQKKDWEQKAIDHFERTGKVLERPGFQPDETKVGFEAEAATGGATTVW